MFNFFQSWKNFKWIILLFITVRIFKTSPAQGSHSHTQIIVPESQKQPNLKREHPLKNIALNALANLKKLKKLSIYQNLLNSSFKIQESELIIFLNAIAKSSQAKKNKGGNISQNSVVTDKIKSFVKKLQILIKLSEEEEQDENIEVVSLFCEKNKPKGNDNSKYKIIFEPGEIKEMLTLILIMSSLNDNTLSS